jgi:hypothetical protein
MAEVNVLCADKAYRPITCESYICPGCGAKIVPSYLYYDHFGGVLLCRCPVEECGSYFMLKQFNGWRSIMPNHPLKTEVFGDTIKSTQVSQVLNI